MPYKDKKDMIPVLKELPVYCGSLECKQINTSLCDQFSNKETHKSCGSPEEEPQPKMAPRRRGGMG